MRAEIDLLIPVEVKLLTRARPPGWEDQVVRAVNGRFAEELVYLLIPFEHVEREGYGVTGIQPLVDRLEQARDRWGRPYENIYEGVLAWRGTVEAPELEVVSRPITHTCLCAEAECCSVMIRLGEPRLRVSGDYGISGLSLPYGWRRARGESSDGIVAAVTRGQITLWSH